MSTHLLENIIWHALAGTHAGYASGTGTARRYAPGFSPIIGFADPERPDFAALAPFCAIGEHFYSGGWSGAAPPGWELHFEGPMRLLVWDAPPPAADDALAAIRLGPEHVPQMRALIDATAPGPFGPRNREMGEYYGVFADGQLVAMAGERMAAGALREISSVCTHAAHRGRGFARRLVELLVRRELQRGETPFLHVMRDNLPARGIYERMGFRLHEELPLRVVARTA